MELYKETKYEKNLKNSLAIEKHPKVALLIETSNEYARGIIRGIHEYIKRHSKWVIYLGEYSRGEPKPEWLLSWKGDGIIARIENQDMADLIVKCGLPVVDISAANLIPGIPWVETDDYAISNMAVDHLIECGFKSFGFVETSYNWSKWRGEYFVEFLNQKGFKCHYLNIGREANLTWEDEQKEIEGWLTEIPKPIGVFASFDLMARQIIESCNNLGFMVPEEVAVLGVDNDPFICELCTPPLSSIIPNTQKTGYIAASLLEKMIINDDVDKLEYRIKPLGIKNRRSTDTIAVEDHYISKAIHYIYENAQSGVINIKDMLSFIPMSRRVFEKKFETIVGRTPYKEVQRIRINRIKELLHDTDLTLMDVAERAGFEHVSYMSYLFKRETGITPVQYRNSIK